MLGASQALLGQGCPSAPCTFVTTLHTACCHILAADAPDRAALEPRDGPRGRFDPALNSPISPWNPSVPPRNSPAPPPSRARRSRTGPVVELRLFAAVCRMCASATLLLPWKGGSPPTIVDRALLQVYPLPARGGRTVTRRVSPHLGCGLSVWEWTQGSPQQTPRSSPSRGSAGGERDRDADAAMSVC